jgi:hypothetical protein
MCISQPVEIIGKSLDFTFNCDRMLSMAPKRPFSELDWYPFCIFPVGVMVVGEGGGWHFLPANLG